MLTRFREMDTIDFPAQVAAETRKLINRGTLAPGFQLRQSDLAERFGISRVPIREALKLLAAEGIIEHDPNRGFFVAQLSSEEARQLYRMRQLLEAELLITIEWPTPAQMKRLKAMLARLEELLSAGNREGWIEHHRAFHDMIFDLSPNKVIKREVLRMMRLTDRYRALAADISAHPQHRSANIETQLLKALESKDRDLLLATYEKGRTVVLEGLMAVLAAREA
ncbi:HTH-type transcriptional regulator McbR [Paraburkholderia rhynchosiae]|uniref:GntR family transcriptional regulator n=2 Tax=Paraburkholderia rhynchosiae TaxID=487049 RepID=A0A2N7WDK5_9BURK|nr:GntR family transcriptional regulator [Paraburkholderia rhynchosiae]CAB3723772.1 HTH-type transcriptional regulator McbR [Paraburkholderia rhynchosiae]